MKYNIVETYENATVVPYIGHLDHAQYACAYDINAKCIKSSIQRAKRVYGNIPYIEAKKKIKKEVIYGGPFISVHIGHFILETLPRLWFAKQNPHLPIVWATKKPTTPPPYISEIFNILEIKNEFIFLDNSTKIEKLHVPIALATINHYYTEDYFDFLGVYKGKPIVANKKVFVSRSNITSTCDRGYINEAEIEEYARNNGYEILIPENVSMKERLDIVSSAEEILMIEGSSFFSFYLIENFKAKVRFIPRVPDSSFVEAGNYISADIAFLDCKSKILSIEYNNSSNRITLEIADLDYSIKNDILLNRNEEYNKHTSIENALKEQNNIMSIRFKSIALLKKISYEDNIEIKLNLFEEALDIFIDKAELNFEQNYFGTLLDKGFKKNHHKYEIKTIESAVVYLDQPIIHLYFNLLKQNINFLSLTQHKNKYIKELISSFYAYLKLDYIVLYNPFYFMLSPYMTFEQKKEFCEKLANHEISEELSLYHIPIANRYHILISFYLESNQEEKIEDLITKINALPIYTVNMHRAIKLPLNNIYYYKKKDYKSALENILGAFEYRENWVDGYNLLRDYYERTNETEKAIENAYKAVELEPEKYNYQISLLNLLYKTKQFDKVKEQVTKAKKIDNTWNLRRYTKSYLYQKSKYMFYKYLSEITFGNTRKSLKKKKHALAKLV